MQNNNLKNQIQEAINHIDRALAAKILRGMKKGEITAPQALNFQKQLQVVNFPDLENEEAASIMKNNVLDFFRLQIPFEERLMARYTSQGSYQKNNQRILLKKALLENTEKLGNFTIGQWVKKFDETHDAEERTEQNILHFLINHRDAIGLSNAQRNVLKSVFKAYDELLAHTLYDVYDLVDAQRRAKEKGLPQEMFAPRAPYAAYREGYAAPAGETLRRVAQEREIAPEAQPVVREEPKIEEENIIQIPFKMAAQKYPQIYEQTISDLPIDSTSSPKPLKPTIRNWIRDYYDTMGTEKHSTIEISNYLYNNPNTKRISESQRQMLSEIIKSLEENIPLNVDANNKKIVFEKRQAPATPKPQSQPQQYARTETNIPSPEITQNESVNRTSARNMELSSAFHSRNKNISNVKFDAPHTLPSEKELGKKYDI